jgi:hypothetical protein
MRWIRRTPLPNPHRIWVDAGAFLLVTIIPVAALMGQPAVIEALPSRQALILGQQLSLKRLKVET